MPKLRVKIKHLVDDLKIPSYAHGGDVGLDLHSREKKVLKPGGHHIFFLGFALEFPAGYAGLVKDRGSMAKLGLHTLGGVYDAGYRGEYNVHLVNLGKKSYTVENGHKIAQLVMLPVALATFKKVVSLSSSLRGDGRWGSTGR
jgi:dUTP pyrophosphatase